MLGDLTDFVIGQEGFAPRAAWDYKQYTDGYGTRAAAPGEVVDRATAAARLKRELTRAASSVSAFAPNAPDGVKAALTDLTFNAGPGWQRSGLGRAVRAGDYDKARDLFLQYDHAGGEVLPALARRRQAAVAQFWNRPSGPQLPDAYAALLAPQSQPQKAPMAFDPSTATPAYGPGVPPQLGMYDALIQQNQNHVENGDARMPDIGYNGPAPAQPAAAAPAQPAAAAPVGFDPSTAQPFDPSTAQPVQVAQPTALGPDGSRGFAQMSGVNSALFGVPNILSAGLDYVLDNGVGNLGRLAFGHPTKYTSYAQELEQISNMESHAAAEHPIVSTLAGLGGTALLPLNVLKAPATLARSIGTGAALGAGAGALSGFSQHASPAQALQGAALGAATGGVVGGAAPYAARAATALYDRVRQPVTAALKLIAQKVKLPTETLAQAHARLETAWNELRSDLGRVPSLAELLPYASRQGVQQASELGYAIGSNAKATQTANLAEEAGAAAMPSQLSRAIAGNEPPMNSGVLSTKADNELTAALDAQAPNGGTVRSTPVPARSLLSGDPDTEDQEIGAINRMLSGEGGADVKFATAVANDGTITVGQADEIRKLAATRAEKQTVGANEDFYADIAKRAHAAARAASPEYAAAYDQFVKTKREAAGAATGAQGVTAAPLDFQGAQGELARTSGKNAALAAPAVGPGLRTELSQTALGSQTQAANVAKRLDQSPALQQNLAGTLSAGEAQRIQRAGTAAFKAAQGRAAVSPRPTTESAEQGKNAEETMRGVLLAGHGGSTMAIGHSFITLMRKLRVTPGMSQRLAVLATDPRQLPAVMDYLKRRGASPQQAQGLVRYWLAAQSGNAAGQLQ